MWNPHTINEADHLKAVCMHCNAKVGRGRKEGQLTTRRVINELLGSAICNSRKSNILLMETVLQVLEEGSNGRAV